MVQLPNPYTTTGKTIALTGQTSVSQVMSLLFNTLPRLVIAFLPRSKCLLISWLHSPSSVILEPKKIKSLTVSIISPTICHDMMEPDVMILVFWMLSFKSTGIPSPLLALFVVMLPKAHLTLHSRISGFRWVITPWWLSFFYKIFFSIVFLCILATSS